MSILENLYRDRNGAHVHDFFMNGALVKSDHSQMGHFSNRVIYEWDIGPIGSFMNGAFVEWSRSQTEHWSIGVICQWSIG